MKLQISLSTDTRYQPTQLYFIKPEKIYYNDKEIRAVFRIVPISDNLLSLGSKVEGNFSLDVPGNVKTDQIDIWVLSDLPIYAHSANIIPTRSENIITQDGSFICIYDHTNNILKCVVPQSIFKNEVIDSANVKSNL